MNLHEGKEMKDDRTTFWETAASLIWTQSLAGPVWFPVPWVWWWREFGRCHGPYRWDKRFGPSKVHRMAPSCQCWWLGYLLRNSWSVYEASWCAWSCFGFRSRVPRSTMKKVKLLKAQLLVEGVLSYLKPLFFVMIYFACASNSNGP